MMKKLEKLIEQSIKNNRKIYLEDILSLNIDFNHYEKLLEVLKKYDIEIIDSFDKNAKIMTKEEEQILFLNYQQALENNDKKTLRNIEEQILIRNEGLIKDFVLKYKGYIKENGYDIDDALQEGRIAIIEAIRKFDIKRNIRFSTYATWWIKKYILRFVMGNNKISMNIKDAQKNIRFKQYCAECELKGYIPSEEECAEKIGTTEEKIKNFKSFNRPIKSLDEPVNDEENINLSYLIEDETSYNEYNLLENKIYIKSIIEDFFDILTPREQEILSSRFELNGYTYENYKDLASKYNISRQRISMIEIKGLEKIRSEIYKTEKYVRIINKLLNEDKSLYLVSIEEELSENSLENLLSDSDTIKKIYKNKYDYILKRLSEKIKESKLAKIK